MKNLSLSFVAVTLLSASLFVSCKKKSDDPQPVVEPPVAVATPQNLTLKFTPVKGDTTLNFFSNFRTSSGVKFNLSMFRYYVSNIKLVKNDGSEYSVANKYLLVTPNTEDYSLGNVPAGDYKGIKFSIGVDSATNHKDPTLYSNTNPLAIQSPAIHWSWNSGYIFMMIEGTCDTTASQNDVLKNGNFSHDLFFHIGMDKFYKQVSLTKSFSISNSAQTISINADIDKMLSGIDLKTENKTHTMNNMPLATKAANNFGTMFIVK
jgi:hypothetical protein